MSDATPIYPPATLGMLGGGQLGRFFVSAAHELGFRVVVLDPDPHSPAGQIADEHVIADYVDTNALERIVQSCAAVTTEFENVPAAALAYLSKFIPIRPGAAAVAICQNRSDEKGFLKRHGFPHASYADIHSEQDLIDAAETLFPGILKVARFGYDGKGQSRVVSRADALVAYARYKGEACVLEGLLPLEAELSVILARGANGIFSAFPPAENTHRAGILDISVVPAFATAPEKGELLKQAEQIAVRIAEAMNYVGVLAVEFFVVADQLIVNEMAPRPHNSGHYTLDACITSQYEQQVRALTGLPLGRTSTHCGSVMVNLLGDLWFQKSPHHSNEPDWAPLLAVPNLKLHLYGKHHARHGRKMGHFTVVDTHLERARALALELRRRIGITDE